MAAADAYRELIDLAAAAAVAQDADVIELARAATRLQPVVVADGRCDHLLDSVRDGVTAAAADPRTAARRLAVDLAELGREAPRELAVAHPDPAATVRASLRWVGPPADADRVAAHFAPDAVSWPNPQLPPPSRFETTLRIGDSASRPQLDGAIGAVLRQLPTLLGTTEGAEPPEHWWAAGRLELAISLPVLGGSREATLSAPVASRLAAWGATLALGIHEG